jgi:hypothetical protein
MNDRIISRNYLNLGIQATFFLLSLKYLTTILHELGHCLGGWVVGLESVGIEAGVFGGGQSYVFGSRNFWHGLLMNISGPAIDLILGLTVLFVILPRVHRWGFKIFWLYIAALGLLAFWGYMLLGGFGIGDFAYITRSIGVTQILAGILGCAGLVGTAYLLRYHIFNTFSPYFRLDTFWKRFGVMLLFIGFPGIVYSAGGFFLSPDQTFEKFFLISLQAIIIPFLISIFIRRSGETPKALPIGPSFVAILFFTIACFIWLGLFRPSYHQARGILWKTPEENSVRVCNVLITLKKDLSAHIEFLMRPHGPALFWDRMKGKMPNWPVYDRFIQTYLPVLIGISEYEVFEKADDKIFPFFYDGLMSKGARKISVIVNLENIIHINDQKTFSLEITDFWRDRGGGYIDRLNIVLEGGMKFSSYELDPNTAKTPNFYDLRELRWENSYYDTRPPEKIRLAISINY